MGISDLIPAQYRFAASVVVGVLLGVVLFGAGWTVNGWRLHSQVEQQKALRSEDRAAVADAGSQAAQRTVAVVTQQARITQEVDHDYQTRRADLVRRLAGNGLRLSSAGSGSDSLPAVADATSEPVAASAEPAPGAGGSAPLADACEPIKQGAALDALQVLEWQAWWQAQVGVGR